MSIWYDDYNLKLKPITDRLGFTEYTKWSFYNLSYFDEKINFQCSIGLYIDDGEYHYSSSFPFNRFTTKDVNLIIKELIKIFPHKFRKEKIENILK